MRKSRWLSRTGLAAPNVWLIASFRGLVLVGVLLVEVEDKRGQRLFSASSPADEQTSAWSVTPHLLSVAGSNETFRPIVTPGDVTTVALGEARNGRPEQMSPLSVKITPSVARVGERLEVTLTVENPNQRALDEFRLFSSGSWGSFTIVGVSPDGGFERSWLGATFSSSAAIGVGSVEQTRILTLANETGDWHFTFVLHPPDGGHHPLFSGGSVVAEADVRDAP